MKVLLLFPIICSLLVILFAQPKDIDQTIEQILALHEEEIDLGLACLLLAKDAYPDMDIAFFDYALDYMANQINFLMEGRSDPEVRIAMMNTYLYRKGWWNDSIAFTYDLDDLKASKKENQFLNAYLATKRGSCITMPMLHLVLADRLDWPIYPVQAPKHYFCRYVQQGFEEGNIEATCGGGYVSDERYIIDFDIPERALKKGTYLRTLTKKEYIASLLINNSRHFYEREGNTTKAIYCPKLALSVDSSLAAAHWNLGSLYYFYGQELETEIKNEIRTEETLYAIDMQAFTKYRNQMNVTPHPPNPNPWANIPNSSSVNPFRLPDISAKKTSPSPIPSPIFKGLVLEISIPVTNNNSRAPNKQMFAPSSPYTKANPMLAQRQSEFQEKMRKIEEKYVALIEEAWARFRWHKDKAKDLGIVTRLPEEFFRLQAKDIEEFRRSGQY